MIMIFIAKSVVDIVYHPFHFLESRFIMQDGRKDLKFYKSIRHAILKIGQRNCLTGWRINIPINFITTFNIISYNSEKLNFLHFLIFVKNNMFLYPLITIRRRLECQDANSASMLRPRYEGIKHCAKLMFYEEKGFRGFYKGFGLFNVHMLLMTGIFGLFVDRESLGY